MKLIIAATAVAALLPAVAAAQDGQPVERVERIVIAGGDGHAVEVPPEGLTREAWGEGRDAMFDRLDANHDGRITREEMHTVAGGPAEWNSDDGRVRIIRREGGDGMRMEGATVNIEGGGDGERRIVIQRRSGDGQPIIIDGETIDIQGGPGGGERQVFVFRGDGPGGLDADQDGRVSFEEMAAPLRRHFDEMDANHDGYLDASEREHGMPHPPMSPVPPGR